jgi:nitrite reductase/ring-hydroxylating ferredoxin subunit
MRKISIARFDDIEDRKPAYALAENVDLMIVRYDGKVSVLYGRCLHRGALLSDGYIASNNLMCGLHDWDYRFDTGVSEYDNHEVLPKFSSFVENGEIYVDGEESRPGKRTIPSPTGATIIGLYAKTHADAIEPHVKAIPSYARDGLKKTGHHGAVGAMGVPRDELPQWSDIQFVTAQLHKPPLLDEEPRRHGCRDRAQCAKAPAPAHSAVCFP